MAGEKLRLAGTVSVLASLAGLAEAQQSVPEEFYELDPIIVRGELQERTLQDTPTSAAVITGQQLEQRGDTDLYDVIERAPNVTNALSRQGFAIRGIDQRGTGGGGSGRTVSVQVDGIALPGNQATFFGPYSTWDLDQVEVLRGPQSTQQGRNALAGAIIIRSADPSYEREFKLRGEYGSRNTRSGAITFNTPLIEDKLAFRFSAESFRTDGWVSNPTRNEDNFDPQSVDTLRAKLRWDPTEDIEAIFSYSRTKNAGGEDIIDEDFFPPHRFVFDDFKAEEGADQDIWGLRVNWDIAEGLRLESETSYFTSDYFRREDFDNSPEPLGYFDRDGEQTSFEQDLRLRFDGEGYAGVVGLFYSKSEVKNPTLFSFDASTQVGFLPVGYLRVNRFSDFGGTSENFAIFGEADIEADRFLPGLSFTLGARYDRERIEDLLVEQVRTDPPADTLPPVFQSLLPPDTSTETDRTFDALLPKFAVSYDWTSDIATSFTVQRGYRAGGAQINAFTGVTNNFDPEYTWNYELALRSQFYDGLLTANANVFYTDWRDQQVGVRGPSGNVLDNNVLNAGRSKLYGGELSLDAQITPDFDLYAGLGYAKSEFIDFESGGVDYSGNRFPHAPEWTGALGGEYRFANGLTLQADASYTGSNFFSIENDPRERSDDYFLVNASARYAWEKLSATLYVRNLLDVEYVNSRFYDEVQGKNFGRTGEPFTIGAFLQYEY